MKINDLNKTSKALAILAASASLLGGLQLFAQTPTLVFTNRWSLAPGSRWDLDTGNLTRGVAINKLTGNVLFSSRVTTNHISIVSGTNGSEVGYINCDPAIITGGAFGLNLVRVADDGVIYGCNLATSVGTFKLYRWNSEADGMTNTPTVAYNDGATPTLTLPRYGDVMDIRGAGTNTQITVSGSSINGFAVFTTTDGTNFTATEITPALGTAETGYALTFNGTNDQIYAKQSGTTAILKYAGFNLGAKTVTLITNITVPSLNLVGVKAGSSNGLNFLVGVRTANATTPHLFNAYNIDGSNAVMTLAGSLNSPANNNNGNAVAATDIGAGMAVANDVNNGILAAGIGVVFSLPPSIIAEPGDQTNALAGGYYVFSAGANGTPAPKYQWYYTDPNSLTTNKVTWAVATNASLTLTNLSTTNSGYYSVVASNATGSATSRLASLVVLPSTLSAAVVPSWTKSVGDLFFLSANNTERGMAYNPVNGHLIIVSRTPTNGVHVVDSTTGNYLHSLDMSAVGTAGTFAINLAGVGADGAVYVANLDSNGTQYEIYRWANDSASTVATVAYGPADPGVGRIGDTFAVRGSGTATELLASSRNGTQVVLFNTSDGSNFNPNTIDVTTEPAGFAGLGLAWGADNTFWSKSSGYQFRHIVYDLSAGTNALLQTFAAGQQTDIALGVDPVNNLVASIVPNTAGGVGTLRSVPSHLDLYDVNAVVNDLTSSTEPTLVDQDFFQTSNVNANGTGAVAFDVPGGRLFALDSNNGLIAAKVVARLFETKPANNVILTWTGPSKLLYSGNAAGPYATNTIATSPFSVSPSGSQFYRLAR